MSDKSAFEISKGFAPDTIRSRGNYRRSGHGFSTGDVVYFDGTVSDWRKSDWLYYNLTGSSDALGIVDVQDDYRFDVVYRGSILLPDNMAVTGPIGTIAENTVYFLSETPGVLTETPPIVDQIDPMVRKPMIVTLNSTGSGFINSLVVNYRGYVEDTYGCVAFIQNLIPVGVIDYIPGGPKNPEDLDGWLLCDGSEYFIEEYPELYSVIGNAYGTPTAADRFRVPDLWHKEPNQSTAEFARRLAQSSLQCPPGCQKAVAVRVYRACCSSLCGICFPGDLCGTSASGGISCCNGYQVDLGDELCFDTNGSGIPGCVNVSSGNYPTPGGFNPPNPDDQCGKMDVYWVLGNCTVAAGGKCCEEFPQGVPFENTGICVQSQIPMGSSNNCPAGCNPNALCMTKFAGSVHEQGVLQCGNCQCSGACNSSHIGDDNATADALCACCGCVDGFWGCAVDGGPNTSSGPNPSSSSGPNPSSSSGPNPSSSSGPNPSSTLAETPASTPAETATQTPTPTPTDTPRATRTPFPSATSTRTPTPTPTPNPTPGYIPPLEGRIMIGKNAGATTPANAYGGNDDIEILEQGGVIGEGIGYAHTSENKNRQAVYHCNFYIRARSVERYVNIETCNGAGGAVRNWIPNGSFNIWQRDTSFAPDTSKIESDHLADLNRYTADRWFRKVGFCPEGFGTNGTGTSAPSSYVGECSRKSFNFIDTTIPDALQNQYPTHFMEYQSFISGPGADTSLEYCVLENRISDVKTLSGELVCLSFWARSNTPGFVYVNLKQHFGYDIPTSSPLTFRSAPAVPVIDGSRPTEGKNSVFSIEQYTEYGVSGTTVFLAKENAHQAHVLAFYMSTGTAPDAATTPGPITYLAADASNKGGVAAVTDKALNLPDSSQVSEILLTPLIVADSPALGLVQVTAPPAKYGVPVPPAVAEQAISLAGRVFFKNTKTADNTKVEGRASEAEVITINDSVSVEQEANVSLPITIGIKCVANNSCETCIPYLQNIRCLGTNIFQNETVQSCIPTLEGSGLVSVSAGQTDASITTSISISKSLYDHVQRFVRGTAGFPSEVTTQAVAFSTSLVQNNPLACRCTTAQTSPDLRAECASMTVPKNFDPTETLGICCVVTVGSVQVGQSGANFVTHTRSENETVHGCTALGGQFIPYSAVDYFSQFEPTHCGVTEDQCSRFAKIEVTQEWQQFQVVFEIPSVENRYIGNSGTDYLAVQLWTHLSNGYCRTYSGAEAPPRNRLGENYGTVECSENSLCEPCVSVYPTSFSYKGTLNLAQFQLETGTEFTGFVKPNTIEDLDHCQAFFEKNSCAGIGDYFPVSGTAFLEYHVELKKQKICTDPRPIISAFNASTSGLSGIDILANSVTPRGFAVGANVTVDDDAALLAFGYECDCDIYRPEELQYLDKQLTWKTAET